MSWAGADRGVHHFIDAGHVGPWGLNQETSFSHSLCNNRVGRPRECLKHVLAMLLVCLQIGRLQQKWGEAKTSLVIGGHKFDHQVEVRKSSVPLTTTRVYRAKDVVESGKT